MQDLKFFDVNCRIGVPMNSTREFAADAGKLLAEMDYAGVEKAVICYINTAPAGAVMGNLYVDRALQQDPKQRLTGCWCVLPECLDEKMPAGADFYRAMRDNRVKMVEICPTYHRWVPRRISIGRQFDEFAERNIVVKISVEEAGGWGGFYDLVERFPNNRFLITNTNLWGCDRYIRPFFETTDKVFMEICEYWVADGLAQLVAKYGAGQLLYGSGYPFWNHASQMMNIRHAQIAEADRQKIAAGNLERLLSEVQL